MMLPSLTLARKYMRKTDIGESPEHGVSIYFHGVDFEKGIQRWQIVHWMKVAI